MTHGLLSESKVKAVTPPLYLSNIYFRETVGNIKVYLILVNLVIFRSLCGIQSYSIVLSSYSFLDTYII